MTRENIEALTQIIILQCGADDEVAHLLSKILDSDASQRALIEQQAREIAGLREDLDCAERALILLRAERIKEHS